jgi:hypothetical protein
VVQRLNDFRVPINSTVKLTFSRRVKLPTEFGDIDEGEYVPFSERPEEDRGESEGGPPPSAAPAEGDGSGGGGGWAAADDIDIDEGVRGGEGEHNDPGEKEGEVSLSR